MKKILILIICLLPLKALSQSFPIPITGFCGLKESTEKIMQGLGRKPFAQGEGNILSTIDKTLPGTLLIFVNPESWEYSIIMANPNNTLWCLIAEGKNFRSSVLGSPV